MFQHGVNRKLDSKSLDACVGIQVLLGNQWGQAWKQLFTVRFTIHPCFTSQNLELVLFSSIVDALHIYQDFFTNNNLLSRLKVIK